MTLPLVLASASEIRRQMLLNAGVSVEAIPARVDEAAIRASLCAEGAPPRDIADALAEAKARKIGERHPERLVLGCDQVLAFKGEVFGKPIDLDEARAQIRRLSGDRHTLLSAAVLYCDAKPVWRHVGIVRLTMRTIGEAYLDDYLVRNWDSIRHSVGGYKLEQEGARLFSRIEGDYFTVLGLPLLELLSYLTLRGDIPG
ncbi:septum formation protein Maf [Meridianimarinicoccus roseus]|uniref:Nucleoside triphosphate pyrophosphatase n=1 Tax=Meridianimarinicoccus roseus TaxID=2072018 RepID=A0A2V2LBU3_9RHOB|nr:Maf family protein [Meridianimarinicoccus roseus]PWR02888.1 septum formation protein Maf [Meridianimarinicoccus roseus]